MTAVAQLVKYRKKAQQFYGQAIGIHNENYISPLQKAKLSNPYSDWAGTYDPGDDQGYWDNYGFGDDVSRDVASRLKSSYTKKYYKPKAMRKRAETLQTGIISRALSGGGFLDPALQQQAYDREYEAIDKGFGEQTDVMSSYLNRALPAYDEKVSGYGTAMATRSLYSNRANLNRAVESQKRQDQIEALGMGADFISGNTEFDSAMGSSVMQLNAQRSGQQAQLDQTYSQGANQLGYGLGQFATYSALSKYAKE